MANSIANLIRLHKWSLGVSLAQVAAKFFALLPSWRYYSAVGGTHEVYLRRSSSAAAESAD